MRAGLGRETVREARTLSLSLSEISDEEPSDRHSKVESRPRALPRSGSGAQVFERRRSGASSGAIAHSALGSGNSGRGRGTRRPHRLGMIAILALYTKRNRCGWRCFRCTPAELAAPLAERLLRDITEHVGRLKRNAQYDSQSDLLRQRVGQSMRTPRRRQAPCLAPRTCCAASIEKEHGPTKAPRLHNRHSLPRRRQGMAGGLRRWGRSLRSGGSGRPDDGTFHLPPLAPAPTVNAGARQDYAAGLASLRHDSSVPAALASFERAVRADPDSALAYGGLAEAQWFKYFLTRQRSWLDLSAESARQAERRNPDLAPVHRVAGLHLANGAPTSRPRQSTVAPSN